jgi:hypothetical protein
MVRLTRFCNHSFPYRIDILELSQAPLVGKELCQRLNQLQALTPNTNFHCILLILQPDTGAAAGLFGNSSYVFHQSQKAVVPVPGGGGNLSIIDSSNFPIAKTIAATVVSLEPNGLRELHWHPNVSQRHLIIEGFF